MTASMAAYAALPLETDVTRSETVFVISSASEPASAAVDLAICVRRSGPTHLGPARGALVPVSEYRANRGRCHSILPTTLRNCRCSWVLPRNKGARPVVKGLCSGGVEFLMKLAQVTSACTPSVWFAHD